MLATVTVPTNRFWSRLTVVALVGLTLRVVVYLAEHRGKRISIFNDEEYYSQQAIDLTRGVLFQDPEVGGHAAEHGPLTPVLLAPFSWTESVDWQRAGSIVVGVAVVVVLGLAGRRLGGARVGLLAAGIGALYPNLWMNDGLVMSEGAGALLVAGWLLAGLRWRDRPGTDTAIVWGVVGGLATLTRSELGLLVVLSVVIVAVTRPAGSLRRAGTVAVCAVAVTSPWLVWNAVRFERPVALTTNDGTTLRGANCDEVYRGRAIGSWSVRCLVLDGGGTVREEASVRAGIWRREGLEHVGDNLDRVPAVLVARAARLLDIGHLDHMVDEDVRDGRPRWASWLGVATWWLLAPLAVVGVLRARAGTRLLLAAPAVVVVVTSLLFYGGHRIRSPVEPVVALAVASTLGQGWRERLAGQLGQPGEPDVGHLGQA